jgi:hypothetical protein
MAPNVADLLDTARDADPEADWVVIHHEETDGTAVVTRESFQQEGGHKDRGWAIVEDKSKALPAGDAGAGQDQPKSHRAAHVAKEA